MNILLHYSNNAKYRFTFQIKLVSVTPALSAVDYAAIECTITNTFENKTHKTLPHTSQRLSWLYTNI